MKIFHAASAGLFGQMLDVPLMRDHDILTQVAILMAGEVASLLLSRMTVPILFYLNERKKHR